MKITCCHNCTEKRQQLNATGTNCHMICEEYILQKAKLDAQKDNYSSNREFNVYKNSVKRQKRFFDK